MMLKNWGTVLFTLMVVVVTAQHKVTIRITGVPASPAQPELFITGNYNKWLPAEKQMQITKSDKGLYQITLPDVKPGLLEFKFNRGNWQLLECTAAGKLANPHTAIIKNDTTLEVKIAGWRDQYPANTASAQVHLLSDSFYIPQLKTWRTIWVYLPKGYGTGKKRYPVLYMHDGQALFDEATSEGRTGPVEWAVDETADNYEEGCIIVAVNHNHDKKKRIQEYYVTANEDYDTVYGKQYLDFIIHNLKPHIDKKYRTLGGQQHTYMAGSSMGGLLTLYAGLMYPQVFGRLGVLSPSVWLDFENSYQLINNIVPNKWYTSQRYYFYAGGNENRMKKDSSYVEMHNDVQQTIAAIQKKIQPQIKLAINPEGRHGPWYWSLAFPAFYHWLLQP